VQADHDSLERIEATLHQAYTLEESFQTRSRLLFNVPIVHQPVETAIPSPPRGTRPS